MTRLFWKFFASLWLAQIVTALGVGITIWMVHPLRDERVVRYEVIGGGPPPPPPGALQAPPSGVPPPALPAPLAQPLRPPPPRPPRPFWVPLVLPTLGGGIVSAVFAALLAWYFSRPIGQLRDAFGALAAGDLGARAGPAMNHRHDALADLGNAFDRMADRLQSLVEMQRNLLHDVSHEMRSPLARLQAAADLLAQQPARSDELTARIGSEVSRIDRLVDELLVLARADRALAGDAGEVIDLRALVGAIVADAGFEHDGQRRVTLQAPVATPVLGDPALLRRAIENVVRNALKYGNADGEVSITLAVDGSVATLAIADDGPGVAPTEVEAIFEPFRRGRHARPFDGHGLGLAIARRVMAAHGGSIRAANRLPHGLSVTCRLPLHGITPP